MAKLIIPGFSAGIFYYERPGSPEEYIQGGTFRVRRTFEVAWGQRWLFCYGMMGGPRFIPGQVPQDFGAIRRVPPVGHRTIFGGLADTQGPWMFPTNVEKVEGIGKITGVDRDFSPTGTHEYPIYTTARVTLGYETATYTILSDEQMVAKGYYDPISGQPDERTMARFVTRFQQPTAEYLTLPFGGLRWVSDGSFVRGSHGKVLAATELVYVWHQIPGVPTAVKTHIGSVNHAAFNDGKRTYDRGTLLLTSADLKPYRWFFGQMVFDITYKIKYFQPKTGLDTTTDQDKKEGAAQGVKIDEPFGHNHFLRYKIKKGEESKQGQPRILNPPTYEMMSDNGIRPSESSARRGTTVYEYKDFTELFTLQNSDGNQGDEVP